MNVVLGFDPGGKGAFGWAIAQFDGGLPLQLKACGDADHAQEAVEDIRALLGPSEKVVAAGIDSPLYWTPSCDRAADSMVRQWLRDQGAPSPGGTVQHVNSLRGACVVQGMVCGILLRQEFGGIQICEAHPKALLWRLGLATTHRPPAEILVSDLSAFVQGGRGQNSEHARDAVLGVVSAWAMYVNAPGWIDLMALEEGVIQPLSGPLGYWMPAES